MTSALLTLEGVSAGYNGIPVFSGLTLGIEAGAFAAIVGPTGAGKTTLLKVMLGALSPFAGRVLLKGETLGGANRARVGYVPQRTATDEYFPVTVEQVILMGLRGRRLPPWPTLEERRSAAALADRLGIAGVLRHHICDVSGGQQQRTFRADRKHLCGHCPETRGPLGCSQLAPVPARADNCPRTAARAADQDADEARGCQGGSRSGRVATEPADRVATISIRRYF